MPLHSTVVQSSPLHFILVRKPRERQPYAVILHERSPPLYVAAWKQDHRGIGNPEREDQHHDPGEDQPRRFPL